MLINRVNLEGMFTGFSTAFNKGFDGAESVYHKITMKVTSSGREEKYGWLGAMPGLREWIGDRVIHNLSLHDWAIVNRTFESTVGVRREDVEDDRYGLLAPFITEMGRTAALHPDLLTFELLKSAFSTPCYDGQNFFDTDHPVGIDSAVASVSNMQSGDGEPWFLFDTTRALKPIVFQERVPSRFQSLTKDDDENVFLRDEFLYGVRARHNVGFGLWQLAFASKQPLTAENYEAARTAMMLFKNDRGMPLGIKPNLLVAGPNFEGAAMRLLNNGTRAAIIDGVPGLVQNEWSGTATPIITPYLA